MNTCRLCGHKRSKHFGIGCNEEIAYNLRKGVIKIRCPCTKFVRGI